MNPLSQAFGRQRLVLSLAFLLSVIGLVAWFTMDRQEDPFFPHRVGDIIVPYPGAEPEQVERLVLNPLQKELAQIEEVKEIWGTARLGFAHLTVHLHQHIYDTDSAWDRIRIAADRAARRFPPRAGPVDVDDRILETHGIVLAVTGSDDLLVLNEAAERLRRELFRLKGIARIELLGDPGRQVVITWDDAVAELTGLDALALGEQLAARNLALPGGALAVGNRTVVLDPVTEFTSVEELAATPIRTARGERLPLGELAGVRLSVAQPVAERIWHDGRPAVALAVVIPDKRSNAVRFGRDLRNFVDELRPAYAPLDIETMFHQPYWVERRLSELGFSLLIGIGLVGATLFLATGLRMGLIVAAILPLTTFSALAVYALGGGVLHQISIAGMVIALGMLVDNALVVTESIQWHRDRGVPPAEAALQAVRELAGPLMAATGTTLAAFLPLLLSHGDVADFTRGIPVMVMLTLVISYACAVFVTPLLASAALRPQSERRSVVFARLGGAAGHVAARHPGLVLAGTSVLLLAAGALAQKLEHEFFPDTDRNQLIVDLHFSEGTHVDHTTRRAAELAEWLSARPGVQRVHRFVGFAGPRFYYNLTGQPQQSHLARLVVETDRVEDLSGLMDWVRTTAPGHLPEAELIAHRLGQGPPVEAPVEIRLFAEDRARLAQAADRVLALMRSDEGVRDARHRVGSGLPTLRVHVDDARAAELGLSRRDVALALTRASHGLETGTWRAEREPAPILVRAPEGEAFPPEGLSGLRIATPDGRAVPLGEVAGLESVWQPAVIRHLDLRRMTAVLANAAEGHTYVGVLDRIRPQLAALDLPDGVEYAIGGSAAEAGSANAALFRALPAGALLLIVILLAQFNSFRQVGIVLATIPLAAIGVVPGLFLAGQAVSFTAILGMVALVGIVVNNAIVLIDLMNANRDQGMAIEDAVVAAVARRTRPVLLTTATTVVGMVPLTLTQSTLWPPMAWAIISGLIASTLLTLLVIPALYRVSVRARPAAAAGGPPAAMPE